MEMKKIRNIILLVACVLSASCSDEETAHRLEVMASNVAFSAMGGTGSIQVVAASEITAVSDKEWCKVSVEENVVKVFADENESLEGRTAAVIITAGSEDTLVPVSQEGCIVVFKKTELGQNLPYEGGSATVTLRSNKTCQITIPELAQEWLSCSWNAEKGELTFVAQPSVDDSPRGTSVTVTVGDKTIIYRVGSYAEKDIAGRWIVSFRNGDGETARKIVTFSPSENGTYYVSALSPDYGVPMPFVFENGAFRIKAGALLAEADDSQYHYFIYSTVLTENGFVNWDSEYSYTAYPTSTQSGKFALWFGSDIDLGDDAINGIAFWLFKTQPPTGSSHAGGLEYFYNITMQRY